MNRRSSVGWSKRHLFVLLASELTMQTTMNNAAFGFRFHLAAALGAIVAVFLWRAQQHIDRVAVVDIDAWSADSPADTKNPFVETRRERSIRAQFREPVLFVGSEAVVPAKKAATNAGAEEAIPEPVLKRARQVYQERCAACHGDKGDGNGLGAAYVKPKPRDYTDPEWQKSVTDEELADTIVKGGTAVGKSYMMPANRDLKAKPEVVRGLVWLVRSFANSQ